MANIHSQKKRIARSRRERMENRKRLSQVGTWFRRLRTAADGGDTETIETEHRELVRRIDKAVQAGALHRNAGARKKAQAAAVRAGAPDRVERATSA